MEGKLMAKEIKVNKWNGQDNFNCPYCPHATTEGKDVMQAHILGTHANELRESEVEEMMAAATKHTGGVLGGAGSDDDEGKK